MHQYFFHFVLILLITACKNSTSPENKPSIPAVSTSGVTVVNDSSVLSGGIITSNGGADVTARGVCWNTNADPTIEDNLSSDGTGTGIFTSTITGLSADSAYYVRAYAVNSAGTGYGASVSFHTSLINHILSYLGQTPPGRVLRQFAPGIVPDYTHSAVTVSPNGKEIYWTNNSSIIMTQFRDGGWTSPETASFSGGGTTFMYDDNPVVSPDNNKLFFTSHRPIGYTTNNNEHIWYVERTSSGWSEAQPLPQAVNSIPGLHWQISVSDSGTLYYSAGLRIYFSQFMNGRYVQPEPLTAINNFGDVGCPFIAPDESYIIFYNEVEDQAYLYISFKSTDSQWLPPQRLFQIPPGNSCSFVSRDGKYLFVHNQWISAEIIEDMRCT